MENLKQKSKEFLESISKIKKFAHRQNRSLDFQPGILMTMRIINKNYLNNKDDENYIGMKTSDLTKKLCVTKPATSKMLNILEDRGYIERSSNKADRRVVYVKLTEEGEQFLKQESIRFEKFTCEIVERMGEEDTDNLIRLFGKLYDVLEELQHEK